MNDKGDTSGESTSRLEHSAEITGQPAMSWRLAGASWVGLLRHDNQDSAFASPKLIGVADGMGGEAAGDLASIVATRQLWLASAGLASPIADGLAQAVKAADTDISELVRYDPDLSGMGTTICAAGFDGHELAFVHIGDSRAYLWRDNTMTQLTHDHSFVQQLIDQGQLTQEQARLHPKRSLVMRIVNGTPLSRPDKFVSRPLLGDRYMFCSDGISAFVEPEDLVTAMQCDTLDEAVDMLLDRASLAGAPDNATIVLAQMVPQDDALDAVAPQVWGAAMALRSPADTVPDDPSADIVTRLRSWGIDVLPPETELPVAPRPSGGKSLRGLHWPLRALVVLLVVVVLGVGLVGTRAWLRSQYFIGVVDEQAAIFQGAPYRVGPWYLSSIVETSQVQLADLPVYYAEQVRSWRIRPGSAAAAEQSLAELKVKADACIAYRVNPLQAPIDEDCP